MIAETVSPAVLEPGFCPYKGLQPYTEADRAYFFGRDRDREIIISNLYAAPLTVFYGTSGVGKSSVLLAGVVPRLRQTPRLAVVVFRNWQGGFLAALKSETLSAVKQSTGKDLQIPDGLPLDEFFVECTKALRGSIFIILDQFEEYFLYPTAQADSGFEAEFACAVNRQEVKVNFLLCMREDGLSKLDRFQGRISNLLANMLRLEHLDRASAIKAIHEPLIEYNKHVPPARQMQIEDQLVEALLAEVNPGKMTFSDSGQNIESLPVESAETRIETPLLQMVLTRLWNEELAVNSQAMRLDTLRRLGGAKSIIRTHLDNVMEQLSDAERADAACVLRFMVTPAGTKIAQESGSLTSWSDLPEERVEGILTRLSKQDVRILRAVRNLGQPVRYEIFHDVLAAAVLDWRRRYDEQQKLEQFRSQEQERLKQEQEEAARQREREESRRLRKRATVLTLLLLFAVAASAIALYQGRKAIRASKNAHSSKITANAFSQLSRDPELSLLLAIEAVKVSPTSESQEALKEALLNAHTEFVLKHQGGVRGAVFNPDGTLIATTALSDIVRVWDAKTGSLVKELEPQVEPDKYKKGARHVVFSPDGKYLVATNWEGGTTRVWDVSSWQPVALLKATLIPGVDEKSFSTYSAAFSPDSSYLIIASDNPSPQVWKVGSWEQEAVLQGYQRELPTTPSRPVSAGEVVKEDERKGHGSSVYSVAFSPDGKHVVTGGRGNVAWLWQAGTWQPEFELKGHASPVYGLGFSRDSKLVITASYDRMARVFETETGKQLAVLEHPHAVYDAVFSPTNDDFVTACWDFKVRIWRQKTAGKWTVASELRGHENWVYIAAYSPDGNLLVTGSEDKTARVWRTTDPTDLPDSLAELMALAKARTNKRQLTRDEREKYVGDE